MKVTQYTLLDYLKKKQLDPQVQEETQQIFSIWKTDGREFPLFIRSLNDGELLQLLAFIPCNLSQETLNDVSRLLHMLNKELDLPGFCIDELSLTAFYRIVLPTLKGELDEKVLDAILNTMEVVCKSFSPAIETVAHGAMTFEEVLKKAQENAKQMD